MDFQQVPKNPPLLTAYHLYKASEDSTNLKSERNRTVFAEEFESAQAPPLTTICLKVMAKNYKGRPINLDIQPIQLKIFYDFIDPDLPIENCINIDDEYYWQRVFALKCKDKLLIKEKSSEKNVCWKNLVVTLKFIEILENMPYEIWVPNEMEKLTKMVAPYLTDLKLSKLQPMRETSFPKEPPPTPSETSTLLEEGGAVGEGEPVKNAVVESVPEVAEKPLEDELGEEEIEPQLYAEAPAEYDYPVEHCHHINLSIVMYLYRLQSLTIEFLPPELDIQYHTRYFNFSYVDMQHLASGISELQNLKTFKIRRSRMDCIKLSIILETLKSMSIEHVEFYYCQLDDECGESLYEFLISTESLQHLDLSGNYFRDSAIDYLASGIENSPSKLYFLGLANNPIGDESLCNLTKVLLSCENVAHVTLSGVKATEWGATCLCNLIRDHPIIKELELLAVPMNGPELIDALDNNHIIQQLLCQGCGLTLDEEFQIELLLQRNRYIKQNPYIGDTTKTAAEINEFVSRIKNPILLAALEWRDRRAECCRKLKEQVRLSSLTRADNLRSSFDSSEAPDEYNAEGFTEKELDQRVALYTQTKKNKNFFRGEE